MIHSLFGAFALTLPVVPEDPKETQIIAQDMLRRPYYKGEDGNLNRQSGCFTQGLHLEVSDSRQATGRVHRIIQHPPPCLACFYSKTLEVCQENPCILVFGRMKTPYSLKTGRPDSVTHQVIEELRAADMTQ